VETPISLAPLLEARSIAIIGASADPLKIGGRPIEYLRRFGFTGRVVPVNPNRDNVQGLTCYRSLVDTEPVDLAIIAAPAAAAVDAVHECLAARTKGIVLFTAGFAEVNEEGRSVQSELARAASEAGSTLLGPNCLGTINAHNRVVATFTTALEAGALPAGQFSYCGQSGALGAYWLDKVVAAGLGVSKWITTGNEAQVTLADGLAYLAQDHETRLIGIYIEDVKRPEVFAAAAEAARAAGKTIVAIKAGRSHAGQLAVAAHTGAQAGDDARYQALLDDCRITRVASLTEMIDAGRLILGEVPPTAAKRLGVVTVSGGAGVLICDAAHDAGLVVPELPPQVRAALDGILPTFVRRQNPIDVTGAVVSNTAMLDRIIAALAESDACDAIVLFFGLMNSIKDDIVAAVRNARLSGKPIVLIWMGSSQASRAAIEHMGIPVFDEIPSAINALAAVSRSGGRRGP
jgi:acyl-CoA synthetase (NDP forming)